MVDLVKNIFKNLITYRDRISLIVYNKKFIDKLDDSSIDKEQPIHNDNKLNEIEFIDKPVTGIRTCMDCSFLYRESIP